MNTNTTRLLRLPVLLAVILAATAMLPAQAYLFQPVESPIGQENRIYLDRIQAQPTYRTGETVVPNLDAVEGEEVRVVLQQGEMLTFLRSDAYRGVSGQKLWVGHSAEGRTTYGSEQSAELYLALDGQYLMAFLVHGADQYWMEAIEVGGDLHFWSHHDGNGFPDDHSPEGLERLARNQREVLPDPHNDPVSSGTNGQRQAAADDCAIRLLIAYTASVGVTDLQAISRIEISTRRFNESNSASNVNFQVELAAIEKVSYDPAVGAGFNAVLNDFESTSDGNMDGIHNLRDLVDADYCQLIVENDVDSFCGMASGIGSNYNTAFAVTRVGCLAGNLTFAHEFGHLHGCKHDPYVLPLPIGKAHGYVWKPDRWRTIMAYNDECDDSGFSCTRVKHWSNPNQDTMGVAFGTPNSSNPFDATHNNREKLNETGLSISQYELRQVNKSIFANQVVTDGEVFQAEGSSTLTKPSSSDFTVQSDGSASFRAANSIIIEPGFLASAGSSFSAYLDACTGFPTSREQQEALDQALSDTRLYPNPASTQTRFEHKGQAGPWTLQLLDAYGRERGHWNGIAVEGWLQQDIPVADLPAGFYFIRLDRGGLTAESALQVIH